MAIRSEQIFSRGRIVVASKIGAVISLTGLVAAFLTPSCPFLLKLIFWFVFCLFSFHWIFGAINTLTITHSRLIDYVYLGIAAIGVFILALNYEEKRYEYGQAERQDEARADLKKSRLELAAGILDLERAACQPTLVQLMPRYCERAKQLGQAFDVEDKSETNKDGSRAVAEYLENVSPPDASDAYRSQAYRPVDLENQKLQLFLLRVRNDLMYIELQKPLPPDDVRNSAYGLFTWPFILAFALTLRLTKTTIEIMDWSISRPSSATTPAPAAPSAPTSPPPSS